MPPLPFGHLPQILLRRYLGEKERNIFEKEKNHEYQIWL